MEATVHYTLSPDGQKAALVAGLSGEADRTVTIEVPPEDINLFAISASGALSADAGSGAVLQKGYYAERWESHRFDIVPDGAVLLAFLRDRRAARLAAIQAKKEADEAEEAESAMAVARRRAVAIAALDAGFERELWEVNLIAPESYLRTRVASDRVVGVREAGEAVLLRPGDHDCGVRVAQILAAIDSERKKDQQIAEASRALPAEPRREAPKLRSDGGLVVSVPAPDGEPWAKRLERVDIAQQEGMAFEGPWVKPGTEVVCAPGDVLVVGARIWTGSRKRGEYKRTRDLYVATPIGLLSAYANSPARGEELLAMPPRERILAVLARSREKAVGVLERIGAADRTGFTPDLCNLYAERGQAWREEIRLLDEAIDAASVEEPIIDIASAAEAIINAGYKSLARTHHPDRGGDTAVMAALTEARRQLRELLAMAASVQP